MNIESPKVLLEIFEKQFRLNNNFRLVRAPGRVNLIGHHTDYNEGFVLPMAINRWISVIAQPREDSLCQIYSVNFQEVYRFFLEDNQKELDSWVNYFKAVISNCYRKGLISKGIDVIISGDIPLGVGLSSSAASEVAMACALQAVYGFELEKLELAKLCQLAENNFVGVECGILDQYTSVFGRENQVLFLDCRNLTHKYIPFLQDDYSLVVCDSSTTHKLVKSEYNDRRKDCEQGVELLNAYISPDTMPLKALRDISMSKFVKLESLLPKKIAKRCRHIVSENERVILAADALENQDVREFGKLMNRSFTSCRDDYEISCREINLLVELAIDYPDCIGACLTGAGFGGCTINLVKKDRIEEFKSYLSEGYQNDMQKKCYFYEFKAVNGFEMMNFTKRDLETSKI